MDLSELYKLMAYNGEAWNLISHASEQRLTNALNVAFPAFQCQYWATSFSEKETVQLKGSFPRWAEYAALTMYDETGSVLKDKNGNDVSINCKQDGYLAGKEFCWRVAISEPCVVLNRIYSASGEKLLSDDEKFEVTVGQKLLSTAPTTRAYSTGKVLERPLQYLLGKEMSSGGNNIPLDSQMYKPPNTVLPGLFPNANATYLLSKIKDDTNCLVFEGDIPSKTQHASGHYDFYGFMAVDFTTTATIQSINQWDMGHWGSGRYSLFFARTEADAVTAGYNKENARHFKLLLEGGRPQSSSSTDNDAEFTEHADGKLVEWADSLCEKATDWTQEEHIDGGIICRIINTADGGVGEGGLWDPDFQTPDGEIKAGNCKRAMGKFYPRLQAGGEISSS